MSVNDSNMRILRSDTLQTRDALVKAAERLFATHGIDAVSMNEITREAGLCQCSVQPRHHV